LKDVMSMIGSPSVFREFRAECDARPVVRALMDAEVVGIALVRGAAHLHVIANAKYAALAGGSVFGRPLRDVIPGVPEIVLKGVLEGGGSAPLREVVTARVAGQPVRRVTFTFHAVSGDATAILVLAEDVTERVRERDRAALFATLVGELLPSMNPRHAVHSVVTQTAQALGAKTASLFLLGSGHGHEETTLRGAPGEWDWTRTSFEVPLHDWPAVEAAVRTGHATYLTATSARAAESGWFEAHGTVGALCVPLRSNGRAIGVLFFDFDTASPPAAATVDFAEQVAAHCAAVLDRARGALH
jgi:GAF domain-containing protein